MTLALVAYEQLPGSLKWLSAVSWSARARDTCMRN